LINAGPTHINFGSIHVNSKSTKHFIYRTFLRLQLVLELLQIIIN